jgi:hypothetical protein
MRRSGFWTRAMADVIAFPVGVRLLGRGRVPPPSKQVLQELMERLVAAGVEPQEIARAAMAVSMRHGLQKSVHDEPSQ